MDRPDQPPKKRGDLPQTDWTPEDYQAHTTETMKALVVFSALLGGFLAVVWLVQALH